MGIVYYFGGSGHVLHLRPFRIMCGCVLTQVMIKKCTWEENGVCDSNVEIIAIAEIYKLPVGVYFVIQDKYCNLTIGCYVPHRLINDPFNIQAVYYTMV
jgi:hypothetical protein